MRFRSRACSLQPITPNSSWCCLSLPNKTPIQNQYLFLQLYLLCSWSCTSPQAMRLANTCWMNDSGPFSPHPSPRWFYWLHRKRKFPLSPAAARGKAQEGRISSFLSARRVCSCHMSLGFPFQTSIGRELERRGYFVAWAALEAAPMWFMFLSSLTKYHNTSLSSDPGQP